MTKRLLFSLICVCSSLVALGYDFEEGGIYYNITSSQNMTAGVTYGKSYGKYETAVVSIPNQVTHNGKTYYVTSIGGHAFSGCTMLTTVIFNSYIKTVGQYAFSGCNALSRITIPENVTSIDNYAFSGCVTLSQVTIEDSNTSLSLGYGSMNGSGYGLFADANLYYFYWGRNLKYDTGYGRSPIANQRNLKDIIIGPNVSSISGYMYYGNSAITSVELPSTVTSLGAHAFHGFSGLTSFTIPQQITSISDYAFAECYSLTSLTIPEWVNSIGAGAFWGCTGFTSFNIPNTLNSIGNYAFASCSNLKKITFEKGLDVDKVTLSLGYGASNGPGYGLFYDCPIESLDLQREISYSTSYSAKWNNQTSSYSYRSPFRNHPTLKKVTIGEQITYINNNLFLNDSYLDDVTLPATAETIGEYTFYGCESLKSITIPASVTTIKNRAFSDCTGLTSFTIPGTLNSIENYAFSNCTGLKTIIFEKGLDVNKVKLSLGYGANDGPGYGLFHDCPIESLDLQREISYSTSYSAKWNDQTSSYSYRSPFRNHETLKKVTFGEDITYIYDNLFLNDKYLEEVTLPSTVETIGNYSFYGCESLKSITIPSSVTSINAWSFAYCTGFSSFTIPGTLNSIGNYAFAGCTGITELKFEKGKEIGATKLSLGYGANDGPGNGLFYDCPLESVDIQRQLTYSTSYSAKWNDKTTNYSNRSPFRDHATLKKAVIGNDITYIYDYLFYRARYLDDVSLPNTVTTIGTAAFNSCESLKSISLPESLEVIGSYAFGACTGFESFTVSSGVTEIKNNAFAGCSNLTSFYIPNNVNSIGNYAFSGCTGITSLKFEKGKDINKKTLSLGYGANDGPGYGLFYDCPIESLDLQREISYSTSYSAKWNDQTSSYSYRSPFRNHATLKKVIFGEDITYVYDYLLLNDKYLEEVTLPYTVETIGNYSFYGCESLKSITIPSSVTTINAWSFAYCTGFSSFTIPGTLNSIGNYAFAGCTGITELKFEKGKEIGATKLSLGYGANDGPGNGLFYDCPLESIDIQRELSYSTNYSAKWNDQTNNYTYRSPFRAHPTLKKAIIGDGAVSVKINLFFNSLLLKDVSISDAVTSIDNYAFYGCESITSMVLPEKLSSIGDYAFSGCNQLTGLIFRPALKSIGNYAFRGCTAFNNFAIEESEEVLNIGNGATDGEKIGLFRDCPIKSVFIGRNLTYNNSPLSYIPTLTEARFGNPVTRIPNYIFQGDTELTSIIFNKSCKLQSVGKYAFEGCINLPVPQFPSTVTSFDEGAFKGCTNFTDFDLPENLVTIGSYTFQDCTGLTKFNFPATITSIGNYAFSGCKEVKEVIFKDGEETLALGYGASQGKGYGLFNDCPLEELYLGRTVSYEVNNKGNFGYSPFYMQEALSTVTVGSKVTELPYCIFYGTAIQELYVPSSVRILHSSFANSCTKLKKLIILGATPPALDSNNTFLYNSAEDSKIYVFFPDVYKTTKTWKDYSDKYEMVCEILSNFTYGGDKHLIAYKTDFPITFGDMETAVADAGTYQKRLDLTYKTNGYTISDILDYEYTIKKAPLTIIAKSCTRYEGEDNPEFKFEFEGFVNKENEKVLTKQPEASTKATKDSPTGEYEIVVSGAEAKNYEISYVNGILTIITSHKIVGDVNRDGSVDAQDIVDLVDYLMGKKDLDFNAADVNGDGIVNSADAIMVSNTILKK